MGSAGQDVKYLTKGDFAVIDLSHRFGPDPVNWSGPVFHNENSLDYAVELVRTGLLDFCFPRSLSEKAAVYCFNTITRHVFRDGNKRTGMTALLLFLMANGIPISDDLSCEEIVETAVAVADHRLEFEDLASWIDRRLISRSSG
jgi:death on curing protein